MRILFINKASLTHEGGAEIRSREIGKRLVSAGHEVVVFTAKTHPQDSPFEILDGMKLYHKKVLPDWLVRRFPFPHYLPQAAANLFLMFHLCSLLKREKFDMIREDVSPFPPSFLLSLVRLKVPRRIAVVHNLPGTLKGWLKFYGPVYGIAGFLFDRLLRAGWLKYDRIVCAAKWLADDLQRSPEIAAKVAYVPNGVDLERFSGRGVIDPIKRGRSLCGHAHPTPIRLLSIGRLVENKGYRYLIEALSLLKADFPQVKLVIYGQGPLKVPLTGLARSLNVGGQIEIRSPVAREEMPQVYCDFDFFVLPSLTEGLPMTILEAMAIRLPIVASDIAGVREILDENTATLAAARNPADLAHKLKWVLDHPDAADKKAELAHEKVRQYDWDMIAKEELGIC
ncbi:MAG: glycosyltransferase family 4 protein [Deltaproteobacteria bacterium]|nr:glycosyltransferase family 4 protein [Deltaproteobacteria bacterium]